MDDLELRKTETQEKTTPMDSPSSDLFDEQTLLDGVRYVLPNRSLGKGRGIGLVVMIVGAFSVGFGVMWILNTLDFASGDDEFARWFGIIFAAVGLMPLLIGLGFFVAGLGLLRGRTHARIELANGALRVTERFGIFRWSWKRSADRVLRLIVGPALSSASATPGGQVFLVIHVECDGVPSMKMAPAYTREQLEALAAALAERLNVTTESAATAPVTVESRSDDGQPLTEVTQPQDSDATIERRDGEMTIKIPPAGLWRGSKGLFFFSILWNGFMVMFTFIFIFADKSQAEGDIRVAYAIIPLFWLIGLGVLAAAVNMGRRRAILDIVGDALLITRAGPFGSKLTEYSADQIESIKVGRSGMEVNDVPVMELQIHPREGKKLGLLSQRDDDELQWIAYELRTALRIGG